MAKLSKLTIFLTFLLFTHTGCALLTQTTEEAVEIQATQTIEKPVEIEVHLWQTYDNDEVQIKIDEQIVFSDAVTTDDILSLAATIPITLSEGSHHIGVTINDSLEAETTFSTRDLVVIAVSYSPPEETISFEFLDFYPTYR